MYPSDTENPLNLERNGSENSVNIAICSFTEIEKIQVMIFLMNIVVHHSIYGVVWGWGESTSQKPFCNLLSILFKVFKKSIRLNVYSFHNLIYSYHSISVDRDFRSCNWFFIDQWFRPFRLFGDFNWVSA